MKRLTYICFFLFLKVLVSSQNIPIVIRSQEKVFVEIADLLDKELPKSIEILIYNPYVLNSNGKKAEEIKSNFNLILFSQDVARKYSLVFIDNVVKNKENITYELIDKATQPELIGLGRLLGLDAVMLSTVTVLKNETKTVWDETNRAFVERNIAIIQGNVYNATDNSLIIRYFYYFLLN